MTETTVQEKLTTFTDSATNLVVVTTRHMHTRTTLTPEEARELAGILTECADKLDPPPRTLKIVEDCDNDFNPRTDFDNVGTMVCFHTRYTLGDETDLRADHFEGWDELEKHLREEENAFVLLPLCLHDHGGISMQVGTSSGWDSGQVGFIYATKEQARQAGWGDLTEQEMEKRVTQCLTHEVETYDQYLRGDVWGYQIVTEDGKVVDSCYGFYGREAAEQEGQLALSN